jgi:branched-chain amino acid transport system substrate-binding protein
MPLFFGVVKRTWHGREMVMNGRKSAVKRLVGTLALALTSCVAMAQSGAWVVGQVAPMSGAAANQGRAYAEGMRLAFEQVNSAGGIQGKALQLVTLDDAGHPEETVAKTKQLLAESKPVVLAGYFGNRSLAALLDSKLLDQAQLTLVGFQSSDTRVLGSPRMFSTRAGLAEEVGKIVTHLATVGITRIALVHDERPDADALYELVSRAVEPAGGKVVIKVPLPSRGGLEKAVDQVHAAQPAPQALLVVAASASTSAFVEHYRMGGGTAQIYANSESDMEQLAKRLPVEFLSGLSIAQVVPSPYKVNVRLNKEFRDAASATSTPLSVPVGYTMMEGYVNGKVLAEAMRRAQPVSREKVTAALRGIDAYDLGGYWVSFRSGGQVGSKYVDLSIINSSGRVTH